MAKSDGYVLIDTTLNTDGFGKGVKNMNKQMGGLTGTVGKLGLAIAAAFSVKALINFGKQSIKLGSDLQEVQNVVDVTFTEMNEQVNEFARNAAETAGLSETMAKRYAGTFGAMAKAFGFAEGEAFDMSASLTQLAGDVASFYNLTQDEAYTKLKSVFTGETETLKDLGVVMTQSALDAYAMAKGYGKTTKEMSEQEKVALRYSFVLDQLSTASGDFRRTSDGWANQMRILNLNFDSFKANIGQALINVFTPFLQTTNRIVARMAELSAYLVTFSETIMGKSSEGNAGDAQKAIASGYEDIADATEEANKAQNKYLTGLDEIQTFANKDDENKNVISGDLIVSTNDIVPSKEELKKPVSDFAENIIEAFKNEDWEKIGNYLGEAIKNSLNKISEKISSVDWQGIGKKIGEFIKGIDWSAAFTGVADVVFEALSAGLKLWKGSFDTSPFETVVLTALLGMKLSGIVLPLKVKLAIVVGAIVFSFAVDAGKELAKATLEWANNKHDLGFTQEWLDAYFGDLDIGKTFEKVMGELKNNPHFGAETFVYLLFGRKIDIQKAMENVNTALISSLKATLNMGIIVLNSFVEKLNDAMNIKWDSLTFMGKEIIPGGNVNLISIPKIPMLATGAVIPPNAPFMAMLGDQKHGTNIEAPLDTIKQAVREVMGNGGGGIYSFSAQINRRVLFEELIEEAKLRQDTTGRNPFDLA